MNQKGKTMNLLKFIMPALAFLAMLLLVPGSSLGEISFKGAVTGGLGIYTDQGVTNDTGTELATGGTEVTDIRGEARAYVDFHGGVGDVVRLRYRVNENPKQLDASRSRVVWKVTDGLKLNFAGQGFGVPATFTAYRGYFVGHFTDGMILGDLIPGKAIYILLNAPGIDTTFSAGNLDVGGGILRARENLSLLDPFFQAVHRLAVDDQVVRRFPRHSCSAGKSDEETILHRLTHPSTI